MLVVIGLSVGVAMVTIAETARENADRHRRAQVLVETIRASGQQLNALRTQALADALASHDREVQVSVPIIESGFRVWRGLTDAVVRLRSVEPSARTAGLERDATTLFRVGTRALNTVDGVPLATAMRDEKVRFGPALTRLNGDAERASTYERVVADEASADARTAFVGSLVLGLFALLFIAGRFQRRRRKSMVEAERRAVENRSEARLRALVEHSTDVVTVVGADLIVQWQAASVERVLGYDADAVIGQPLTSIVHPDDVRLVERFLHASLGREGSHTISARFGHATGGWRTFETVVDNRVDDTAVGGLVLSMRDVTERKTLEDELRHQAFHDSLTGLANRALFEDRLSHAVAIADRRRRAFAVLFLDLDDFKTINDSLGHARGDELLRATANRIRDILRLSDTAARLGGDEFAVLIEADEEEAGLAARRILDALAAPFAIDGRELRMTASMGLALCGAGATVEELLRNADMAMYAAKADGKASIRTFEPSMHRRALERLELTVELRAALEARQFELDYQPIVELRSGRIVGVEALVRWQHPARARLAPDQFIALAEETGLIVPLGLWVLETACTEARRWELAFPDRQLQLSVNVSTRQLAEPDFIATVAEVLRTTGFSPELLAIEITEGLLLGDRDEVVAQLEGLKALGLRVAVDDFGTGYSSLSHLRHFPIDILKIDKSFVDGIEHDAGKAKLVHGIVNLGDSLLLDVVAEGIEQQGQANKFTGLRLPLAQGFLFFPPLPGAEIEALLAAPPAGEVVAVASSS
ncbi:MAG TPA: EAL domain-containing protein [Solirubrobacteraceae bacterium]|jgi:diguanylate cyclase (GGDEF)-like protein/PAS domain S-box-containing protein|nr:EAL domain-containing protein [Solirubrobacteraceae bacterium]